MYSRIDAIVTLRASLLPARALHENVEVRGSHLGLGHNPAVVVVVADRLAQQPDTRRGRRFAEVFAGTVVVPKGSLLPR